MTRTKPVVLAITSDHHANSSVAMCPPEGPRTSDGQVVQPSKVQVWLWERYVRFWSEVAALRRELGASLYCLYNGDAVEGAEGSKQASRTTQLMHMEPDVQTYIAHQVFGVPKKLRPAKQWMVRGTASHVGSEEESLAHWLGCEKDPETGNYSRYHLRLRIHGHLIDAQHHGSMGRLPRTERSLMSLRAFDLLAEYAGWGLEVPSLVIRSHLHRFQDTGPDARPNVPRVIQTPSWQCKSAWVHAKHPNSVPHVGGVIAVFRPDAAVEIIPKLYLPDLPPIEDA